MQNQVATARDSFLILDGHSMIYRAVFRPGLALRSPTGEPTRGTYTFCKMLFALVEERKPAYFAMAVDAPRKSTWRRSIFPEYKAKRDHQPTGDREILIQMARIKEIVQALGIPLIGVDCAEADDIIATLVDICSSEDVECIICSRDKDLHQLIGPNCRMYDPQDREWFDQDSVLKKWGVSSDKVVELQTLTGDPTDNVPGVKGIGPKTALKLIKEYGSVEGVLNSIDKLNPKIQQALRNADLTLCRELVELRRDIPLNVCPTDLEFNGFDMESVKPIFKQLGFRQWL